MSGLDHKAAFKATSALDLAPVGPRPLLQAAATYTGNARPACPLRSLFSTSLSLTIGLPVLFYDLFFNLGRPCDIVILTFLFVFLIPKINCMLSMSILAFITAT